MSRWEFHADDNQTLIVAALGLVGALVWPLDKTGDGVPDLLVGWRRRFFLLEVKNPETVSRKRQRQPKKSLRKDQLEFHEYFAGYPVFIVFTPAQALKAIGAV